MKIDRHEHSEGKKHGQKKKRSRKNEHRGSFVSEKKKKRTKKVKQSYDQMLMLQMMVHAARVIQRGWRRYVKDREVSEEMRLVEIKDALDFPNTPSK